MNENEIILQNPEDGMSKTLQIRNSTIDFLVFTKQNSQDSIEVRVQDENVWLTQDGIARLFDKGRSTIAEHLLTVFKEGELSESSVCRNSDRLPLTAKPTTPSSITLTPSFLWDTA